MASTGNKFPTVGANVDRAGSTAWTNPGNVVSDNASDATAVVPTDYLVTSGYDFSAIPDNATIKGVTVRVEASESGGGDSSYIPQLHSGTTPTLIGSAKSAVVVNGTTKVISTTGGVADLWGAALTPAIVKAAGFGVSIWSTDTTNTLAIDFVTIAIEYVIAFSASINVRGGGSATVTIRKAGRASGVLARGGGAVALSSRAAHQAALAIAGGGVTGLTVRGNHAAALLLGGGGAIALSRQKGGRAPSLLSSGGGSLVIPGRKAGQLAGGIVSSGGSLALLAGGGHTASVVVTGGGGMSVSRESSRTHGLAISAGGSVILEAASQRKQALAIGAGGAVVLEASSGRAAAANVIGGGGIVIDWDVDGGGGPGEHFGASISVRGGGSVSLEHASGRTRSLALSSGGVIAVDHRGAHTATLSVSGGGSIYFRPVHERRPNAVHLAGPTRRRRKRRPRRRRRH